MAETNTKPKPFCVSTRVTFGKKDEALYLRLLEIERKRNVSVNDLLKIGIAAYVELLDKGIYTI